MPSKKKSTVKRRVPCVPAAFLTGLRKIEVDDVPVPEPRAGEALIELSAVGICGSDLHYWRIGRIGPQLVEFPAILGHEPAGRVVALGKGVTRLAEGDLVAVEPGISCGSCAPCLAGRANLCRRVLFLGSPGFTGAFQRFIAMPEQCVERLPAGVDAVLGCVAEPLGIALHAADLVRLRAGQHVAIIGGGPIGLSCAAIALALGAQVVALSDPRPARRKAAEQLGVGRASEASRESFVAAVLAETGGAGADVVLECAGAPEGLDAAVAACRPGARIGCVGIAEVDTHPIDPHAWRRKEIEVQQVRRANCTLPRVLRLLEGQRDLGLRRAGFFSGAVGLGEIQEAFERLEDRAAREIKVLVDPRKV